MLRTCFTGTVRALRGGGRRGRAVSESDFLLSVAARARTDVVGGADVWVGLTASADRRPPAAGDAGRQAGP